MASELKENKGKGSREEGGKDLEEALKKTQQPSGHARQPASVIEMLKNVNSWEVWLRDDGQWTFDEQQLKAACIRYPWMDDGLCQLQADGEKIVRQDDVWSLKDINHVPNA